MAPKKAPAPPIRKYPGYFRPFDPAATFPATLRLFDIDTEKRIQAGEICQQNANMSIEKAEYEKESYDNQISRFGLMGVCFFQR
jgi:hypothetical protein